MLPPRIAVRLGESGKQVEVPLDSLKALFLVKSFEGSKEYCEVKFLQQHPPINGLLVRIRFFDDELTEGVVRNSLHHLVNPGFFLKPPDPQSNNKMGYAGKRSLKGFQVLGVKANH